MLTALFALVHVLVFVYWLGGDLGAFYASRVIGDANRPAAARVAAAGLLANLDMAPRTALILALPSGLTLAVRMGYLAPMTWALGTAWIVAGAWLWVAWRIHLKHLSPNAKVRRFDLAIRWAVLAGLLAVGAGVMSGALAAPLFLGLKLLILAAAIGAGLWVRRLIAPFGLAFAGLVADGPSAEGDRIIASSLARARPAVMVIWALLLAAAFLGLWRPQ